MWQATISGHMDKDISVCLPTSRDIVVMFRGGLGYRAGDQKQFQRKEPDLLGLGHRTK